MWWGWDCRLRGQALTRLLYGDLLATQEVVAHAHRFEVVVLGAIVEG